MLIIVHLDIDGEWEIPALNCPVRKSLPAELPVEEVLVCIQNNVDSKFVAFLYYLSQFLDVGVVVDPPLWLYSFPGHMQPDHIEAPAPQIG